MAETITAAQVVLNSSGLANPDWVKGEFAALGFQTGPVVGISFSIAASVKRFEEVFAVKAEKNGFAVDHLPLAALPDKLRWYVEAVLFTKPPMLFGP